MDLKDYRLSDGLYDELVTQSGRGRIGFGELSKFLRKSDAASLNQKKSGCRACDQNVRHQFHGLQ